MTRRDAARLALALAILAPAAPAVQLATAPAAWHAAADGVLLGRVDAVRCYRPGSGPEIWTATRLQVLEAIKGRLPATVWVTHPGGHLDGHAFAVPDSPALDPGLEAILGLLRRPDGTLALLAQAPPDAPTLALLRALAGAAPAGADLRDAAACPAGEQPLGSLLPGLFGVSSRFIAPDRGEPIHYLVDLDALPAGMATNEALAALDLALAAWSGACSVSFVSDGFASFGTNAFTAGAAASDERVRIQFHDLHNYITGPFTLGMGGRNLVTTPQFPTVAAGGSVGTNRFDRTLAGAVVLEHTRPQLGSVTGLAEVLCHELGHVLSLGHSSTNSPEPSVVLGEAMMYAYYHGDGRGARLGAWDTNSVGLVHPIGNTPPHGHWRAVRAVTRSGTPHAGPLGINRWESRAYDLQGGVLTQVLAGATSSGGTFSLADSTLTYAPGYYYGPYVEPVTEWSGAYDTACLIIGDGTHASPPVRFRIVELAPDGDVFSPPDKLPDEWQALYWPSGGAGSGAADDPDDDDSPNLDEWLNGTHPRHGASRLAITAFDGATLQFPARAQDLYPLHAAPSPAGPFAETGTPFRPAAAAGTGTVSRTTAPNRFFRLEHIP